MDASTIRAQAGKATVCGPRQEHAPSSTTREAPHRDPRFIRCRCGRIRWRTNVFQFRNSEILESDLFRSAYVARKISRLPQTITQTTRRITGVYLLLAASH